MIKNAQTQTILIVPCIDRDMFLESDGTVWFRVPFGPQMGQRRIVSPGTIAHSIVMEAAHKFDPERFPKT